MLSSVRPIHHSRAKLSLIWSVHLCIHMQIQDNRPWPQAPVPSLPMLHSVKSKLLSRRLTKDQEKRVKKACSIAVSGLQTTLSIAKDVASVGGLPGLQAGISSLLVVMDTIKVHRISLRWCLLIMFNGPENESKCGGCRETRNPNRGIEYFSQ
jgi:hypothetical protein